jgi:MerR family transcriptional regulator, repressor of the yfmOP operon
VTAAGTTLGTDAVVPIGELAHRTGVTTRTLRYWEELGLLRPSGRRGGGERLYLPADMARVTRIRDLQELLGFSLAEVRVVLDTPDADALDRVRSEFRWGDAGPARRRTLLAEAAEANDRLLARLDDTLARIQAFRDEQAAKAARLAELLDELDDTDRAPGAGAPTEGEPT